MDDIFKAYGEEVAALSASRSTTEPSYYPAIKTLLSKMLERETLPFEVRTSTSESRSGGGRDMPDLALYDGEGDYRSKRIYDRTRSARNPSWNGNHHTAERAYANRALFSLVSPLLKRLRHR